MKIEKYIGTLIATFILITGFSFLPRNTAPVEECLAPIICWLALVSGFALGIFADSVLILNVNLFFAITFTVLMCFYNRLVEIFGFVFLIPLWAPFLFIGGALGYLLRKHWINNTRRLILASAVILIMLVPIMFVYDTGYKSLSNSQDCLNRAKDALKRNDDVELKRWTESLLAGSSSWPIPPADGPLDFWSDSHNVNFWNDLNRLVYDCADQGKFDQSIALEKRLLSVEYPRAKADTSGPLADLYFRARRYKEAENSYKKLLQQNIESGAESTRFVYELTFKLAIIFSSENRLKEAEDLLTKSINGKANPYCKREKYDLAVIYMKERRFKEAEHLFQELLRDNISSAHSGCGGSGRGTDYAIRLDDLADCYAAQGRYSEAKQLIEEALKIWDGSGNRFYNKFNRQKYAAYELVRLAEVDTQLGQTLAAKMLYKRAVDLYAQIKLAELKPQPNYFLENSSTYADHPFRVVTIADQKQACEKLMKIDKNAH